MLGDPKIDILQNLLRFSIVRKALANSLRDGSQKKRALQRETFPELVPSTPPYLLIAFPHLSSGETDSFPVASVIPISMIAIMMTKVKVHANIWSGRIKSVAWRNRYSTLFRASSSPMRRDFYFWHGK
jgi:hypothetical protein